MINCDNAEFKRPIIWALLFLVAGIFYSYILNGGFIILIVLSALACTLLYKWTRYPPIFLCVLFAAAGFLGMQTSLNDNVIPAENVTFTGTVQDMRYTRTGWQRLIVVADEGIIARPGAHILTFLSPSYRVQIGQLVSFYGNLYTLEGQRNPGGYNEFLVQRGHGVAGRFNARTAETFGTYMNLARRTYLIRNRLVDVYNTVLPFRESMIIQSIVLGERPDMDDRVIAMYRDAGIYHLLVVSGLHLSILMVVFSLVLERFFNRRSAGLIALVVMVGYTILTGASISTIRAVTMAGVMVFGRLLFRNRDALSSVSFACIVLLLIQPLYLFSIGFQLSFGTVFGLVLLTSPTERALTLMGMQQSFLGIPKFRKALAYNIVATVSTYPILAYHFSYISTYSILVNMVIAPTFTLLVIVGIITGLVGLVWVNGALFFAGAVYYLLQFYEVVVGFFLSLPGSIWLVGSWGIIVTLSCLAVILAFGYTFSGFGTNFKKRAKILWLTLIILTAGITFEAIDRRGFHITELDIGSHVMRIGGRTYVINGGGNNRLLGMNTGYLALMPYLDHRGINRADAAFVTGTARNQIMGIIELAMEGRVSTIYISQGLNMGAGHGLRLQVEAERNGIPIYTVEETTVEGIKERLQNK